MNRNDWITVLFILGISVACGALFAWLVFR